MIQNYEIKSINGEEILCLYLNYSYEFGDFFKSSNVLHIKDKVKQYLASMRIKFNGGKILFIVGGLGIASLFLTPADMSDIHALQATYTSNSIIERIIDTDSSFNDALVSVEEGIQKEEDIVIDNIEHNESSSVISTQEEVFEDGSVGGVKIEDLNSISDISTPQIDSSSVTTVEQPIVQEDLITVYRANGSVLQIPFEEYIVGVVAAEMPASFPLEALKAQAVVARTYAKQRLSKGLTLTDSVSTQVYKDESQLRTIWGSSYDIYYSKIKSAVTSTEGLSIYYGGQYIDAVYHSTSNGYTEDAKYVWGNFIPYLQSVSSPWDISASSYLHVDEKSEQVLLNVLGFSISEDTLVEVISRDPSGRVLQVQIGDSLYDGVTLRTILGLRSADFDLEVQNGNLVVTTRGYGHGVGMSQYGAAGMAREGYSFIDILKYYYTGVSIY